MIRQAEFVSPGALRNHYEKVAEGYVAPLREAMAAGDVTPGDPMILAWLLMAIGEAVGLRWIIWDEAKAVPTEVFDEMMAIIARMLGGQTSAAYSDGTNDAPALAQADLGIAIGAGSDVAVETADVILVRSSPLDVVAILTLSRATYRKMVQNLLWATGYNTFAIPLAGGVLYAWGVLLTPALGAVLMSASTVIVAINARLLTIRR